MIRIDHVSPAVLREMRPVFDNGSLFRECAVKMCIGGDEIPIARNESSRIRVFHDLLNDSIMIQERIVSDRSRTTHPRQSSIVFGEHFPRRPHRVPLPDIMERSSRIRSCNDAWDDSLPSTYLGSKLVHQHGRNVCDLIEQNRGEGSSTIAQKIIDVVQVSDLDPSASLESEFIRRTVPESTRVFLILHTQYLVEIVLQFFSSLIRETDHQDVCVLIEQFAMLHSEKTRRPRFRSGFRAT